MAQWNRNTVPKCENKKCSDEVLVTVEKTGYLGIVYRRVVKAIYIPHRHCTVEDMGWNMYDGIPDKVTAWMKLPKPYEPRVKEYGGRENDG